MAPLDFEQSWWGDCANTFHEEQKQLVYARHMGLRADWGGGHPPEFALDGKSVIDIGGGPVSLLLKCSDFSAGVVLDPLPYPQWVVDRYAAHGVEFVCERGETLEGVYDEAWCYNVLQHVDDPAEIAARMLASAPTVRVFEWIDIPAYDGHPHMLTGHDMNEWFGTRGSVFHVNESGAEGVAWCAQIRLL